MAQESCNLDKEEAEILKPPPSSPAPQSSTPSSSSAPPLFTNSIPEFSSAKKPEKSQEPIKRAKPAVRFASRCSSCKRKVGLMGFRCRCGDLFCGQHRYSDTHDCSFDYKAMG